jgi:PKD repeat protein
MFQKILLFCLVFIISSISTFASAQKVEDVFIDIDSNYKYISELQSLFDAWIISPDLHGKFNPYKLLSREEFVGILMETNCTKCIKPDTSYSLIQNFLNKNVYYDVYNDSNYFYCIAEADNKNYVRWYDVGSTCENGDSKINEKPFCPQNTIVLEEALAIVMRAWNILTQNEASAILQSISENGNYKDLTDDVKTKNIDWSLYSFYPYFHKAENFIISEYNVYWEEINYSLLEKKSNKYYPKKNINREDFLKIAVFALKNSDCITKKNENISLEIDLLDSKCSEWSKNCNNADIYYQDTLIDIAGVVDTQCLLWIQNPDWYSWIVHNLSKNTESIYKWMYIDNYNFPNSWNYKIILQVKDNCDNISNVSKNVSISWNGENDFFANIDTKVSEKIKSVDFIPTVVWNNGPYSYLWNFWDDNTSTQKNSTHIYDEYWTYDIILTVIDKDWIEIQIPTTVKILPDDYNIYIWLDVINIWDNKFIDFTWNISDQEWNFTYEWDFWDGNTSNEQNPTHKFTESGTFPITFTVVDDNWNKKAVTTTITVDPDWFWIQISTESENIEEWLEVIFTPILQWWTWPFTYDWTFWDGNTSSNEIPTNIYTNPGEYPVELAVTDASGNIQKTLITIDKDWNIINITIIEPDWFWVQISTESENIEQWLEATFTPIIQGWTGPFIYDWTFWDGNTSSDEIPTNLFTEPGEYQVELFLTDANGNTQTVYTTIVVWWNWISTDIKTLVLSDTKWGFNFEWIITGWVWPFTNSWDFWDNNTSNQENPDYIYSQDGIYPVELTIIDANGNISISSTTVVVIGTINNNFNISVSANPTQGDGPLISTFDVETVWSTWPYTYSWDFWDGTSGVWKTTTHTFIEQGTYTVIITVTDSNGNIKTEFITIIVNKSENWWNENNSEIDSDNDGINDISDKCPGIPGEEDNEWCPIFEETCSTDADCSNNATCRENSKWVSVCSPKNIQDNCNYTWNSTIFWNAVCNSCPCQNNLDFNAQLRNCDVVFPAITSPDWSEIYSKWKYFQIKN